MIEDYSLCRWRNHQQEFETGARHLCKVLRAVRESSNGCSPNLLVHWCVQTSETLGVDYLVHDVLMRSPVSNYPDDSSSRLRGKDDTDSLSSDWEDENLTVDPDVFSSRSDHPELKWHFSIVYSDVWKVPVIYFTVQQMSGAPCSRDEVVDILRQQSPQNRVEDSWDFVSYDEHPMTGTPAFFLHPCRTQERLQLLRCRAQWKQSAQLWSWMSLVFPSLGFAIPAKTFQLVQKRLLARSSGEIEKEVT